MQMHHEERSCLTYLVVRYFFRLVEHLQQLETYRPRSHPSSVVVIQFLHALVTIYVIPKKLHLIQPR